MLVWGGVVPRCTRNMMDASRKIRESTKSLLIVASRPYVDFTISGPKLKLSTVVHQVNC